MKCSISLIGTHEVRAFIAFSKSESSRVSRWQSMMAAHVAGRTANPGEAGAGSGMILGAGRAALNGSEGEEPSSIKTSHIRSCTAKGMDRLKRVMYQRVA